MRRGDGMEQKNRMSLPAPQFYHLFDLERPVNQEIELGKNKKVLPVKEGSVYGPALNGSLVDGGGEWTEIHIEKVKISAKYNLKTDDGKRIIMETEGWKTTSGTNVKVKFQAGTRKYRYLNDVIAVGKYSNQSGKEILSIYGMLPYASTTFPKTDLKLQHLYYVEVSCDMPSFLGKVDEGVEAIIPISGGRFEGKKLRGNILPVGSDWNVVKLGTKIRSHVSTRYMLSTDDNENISLFTDGRLVMPYGSLFKVLSNNKDAANAYYFRQHLCFTTESEAYDWLNDKIGFAVIGASMKQGIKVCYNAYILE